MCVVMAELGVGDLPFELRHGIDEVASAVHPRITIARRMDDDERDRVPDSLLAARSSLGRAG